MSEHAARATCHHTLTTMPRDSLHALVGPLFTGVKKDENSSCFHVASRYIACIEGNQSDEQQKNKMNSTKYTAEEIALEAALSAASNEEGTIQAGDMLRLAPHERPELHTTMSVSRAFTAITGKPYDTDFFCA